MLSFCQKAKITHKIVNSKLIMTIFESFKYNRFSIKKILNCKFTIPEFLFNLWVCKNIQALYQYY